jgi:septal ring factor EnvC (AmiA/AmiB activator)
VESIRKEFSDSIANLVIENKSLREKLTELDARLKEVEKDLAYAKQEAEELEEEIPEGKEA